MKTTKELARELGLIRTRTTSRSNVRKAVVAGQLFKYLIVIDFESTCWQDQKFRTQEIIEFPAVLLNTHTGDVESEFHHYVQPQEQPTLSTFCTQLTGITQVQVEDGIPINLCLRKFGHWLDKLHREKGVVCVGTTTDTSITVNTTCVTWSDWDLGVCLQYECKRKQLLKPAQLTSWIDLRATYRKFYERKPNGLNGALQDVGIEFEGREHSGVDDARNTAKLAYRMMKDGCILKVTKTLKGHERSASCNPSIAGYFTTPGTSALTITKPASSPKQSPNVSKTPSKIPRPLNRTTTIQSSERSNGQSKLRPIVDNKNTHSINAQKNLTPIKSTIKPNFTSLKSNVKSNSTLKTPTKPHTDVSYNKKRKEFTPVKIVTDKTANSPFRKISRKISPKKFSSKDIFVDAMETNKSNIGQLKTQSGLKDHDMNIQQPCQQTNSEQGKLSTNNNLKKSVAVLNNTISTVRYNQTNVFKVPNQMCSGTTLQTPRGGKNGFSTSTPASTNVVSRGFNQSNVQSPIVTSGDKDSTKTTSTINTPASLLQLHQTGEKYTPYVLITPKSSNSTMHTSAKSGYISLSSTGFKTPNSYNSMSSSSASMIGSSMKVTPPLCKCGRRSKRKMVQLPGQNMGRFFFSCSVRKGMGSKEGCEFFKWEVAGGMNNTSNGRSSSMISRQFTPVVGNGRIQSYTASQKKNLGVRSGLSQSVCIR